jgi:homoserine dehydrogenase
VGDLIDVGRNLAIGGQGSAIPYGMGMRTEGIDSLVTGQYLRILVVDKPMVLGSVATTFGRHDVSIAAMEMRTLDEGRGEIVFLAHPCIERNFRAALKELQSQQIVERIANAIRVV